ncbi:mycothiol transferase (plasmid) [Streptomyces sp. BI20]|uniref:mycothiol transferase n=1 Tax=Streptomyces sp. BI20 TaxID=3403460 RepID=UPI003C70DC31
MKSAEVLVDAFGRVREGVAEVLDGLTLDDLHARVDPGANSIGWLVWHLARVQDDHVAEPAGREQVWLSEGWAERLALPYQPREHGYGHTAEQVGRFRIAAVADLAGYVEAVHTRTVSFVERLTDADLDRIVDEAWDPPVTLGVRLVSVIADDLQHLGQAAYLRGMLARRTTNPGTGVDA